MSESIWTSPALLAQFRRQPSAYAPSESPGDRKFVAFMVSTAGADRDDIVLDVACGPGAATFAFAERCRAAIGIDFADDALARARAEADARGVANAEFIAGEFERMPLKSGGVNGAICRFSFHHFVNPKRVFAEMARVVGDRGWMLIADLLSADDPEKSELHNRMERLSDPTHARALPAGEFEAMFAAEGFRIAMKIVRETRTSFDDWISFNRTPPERAAPLRALMEEAAEGDRAGLKMTRDGDTIRTVRASATYLIERE